jgi:hypothetical protein
VDVLKKVHGWLRKDGVLLDLHPEPAQPIVKVVLGDGRAIKLGKVDNSAVITNIRAARAVLDSAVRAHWLVRERALVFDFVSHFASVDDWLAHRAARRSRSLVHPFIVARARELVGAPGGGELLVCERVLAARLRRGEARLEQ